MGYELHVLRRGGGRIPEAEWLEYLAPDPELSPVKKLEGLEPRSGARIVVRGGGTVCWDGHPSGRAAVLTYHRGIVSAKNPDPATIAKLKQIAERLDAEVVGDSGETY